MPRFRLTSRIVSAALLACLADPASSLAQPVLDVRDAFTDGDFARNPAWTSPEPATWTVAARGGNPALTSNGPARADTLSISTASNVSVGRWRIRFAWSGVNLSTANGVRVFLISDRDDLSGPVRGYALQLGTTNTDDVRLVRFDGDPAVTANRVLLGQSAVVLAGDAGEIMIEVTRTAAGVWTVTAGTAPPFTATDATHLASTAFGLWVKHSAATGRAYALDDVEVAGTAGPPDTTAPRVADVQVNDAPPEIALTFSEPVATTTLTPGAFALVPALPFAVVPTDAGGVSAGARLVFGARMPVGAYTLGVRGLADVAGNVMRDTTLAVALERDETAPVLTSARFADARRLSVAFSEAVINGCAPGPFAVTRQGGTDMGVVSVTCPTGLATGVTLVLSEDVLPGQTVVVAARDLRDAAGNATTSSVSATRPDLALAGDVVVNEVLFAPPTGGSEWVEIFNRSPRALDLADLRLSDATAPARPIATRPAPLAPGDYAVVVQDSAAFAATYGPLPSGVAIVRLAPWPALNNDADAVVLRRNDGLRIDSLAYSGSWGVPARSLERRDPDGPPVRVNLAASFDPRGGTPGQRNSVYAIDSAGPLALRAERGPDGMLAVTFDEPLDPASTSGAFSTDAGQPASVSLVGDGSAVLLGGVGGAARVTTTGVRDRKGNASATQTIAVSGPPVSGGLAVVEAMLAPRTSGEHPQVEYVEIVNVSPVALALRTVVLVARPIVSDGESPPATDTTRFDDADRTLLPGGRLVVYDADASDGPDAATASRLARAFPSVDFRDPLIVLVGRSTVTSGGLSNAGECLTLRSAGSVIAPETCLRGTWADPGRSPGSSLERILPGADGPVNWASSPSPDGGTPGRPNAATPIEGATSDLAGLRLSEVLYQPLADARDGRADQAEFVEIAHTGSVSVDLNGLVLLGAPDEAGRRDSVRLAFVPTRLGPGGFAVAFRSSTAVPTAAAFRAAFPGMPADAVVLAAPGLSLSDSGDRLALHRLGATGKGPEIDGARYAPTFHSAALRTATGVSLERLALDRAADDASAWASSPSPDGATPGAVNAVIANAAGAPTQAGLAASPSPFSPDGDGADDAALFAYRLRAAASSVRLRVYDADGRLVRTLPTGPAGLTGTLAWDGADDTGRALPMGIYIALLDAVDERGGRTELHRTVVTLARRL